MSTRTVRRTAQPNEEPKQETAAIGTPTLAAHFALDKGELTALPWVGLHDTEDLLVTYER